MIGQLVNREQSLIMCIFCKWGNLEEVGSSQRRLVKSRTSWLSEQPYLFWMDWMKPVAMTQL